MLGEEMKFIDI